MGAKERRIAILSDNPETLAGLEGYLRNVGLPAICRRTLAVEDLDAKSTRAILIFPDDFDPEEVRNALRTLIDQGGRPLKIIVSGRPTIYETMLADRRGFIVVVRPVWGWAIVDAIRNYESNGEGPTSSDGRKKDEP